jgi:broad specificity phosphatase PhoE
LARDAAEASGEALIDIAGRDMDVPLSPTGEAQARALGRWLATRELPTVVYASPYERAAATAELACATSGCPSEIRFDERLREREFGVLDRLTRTGIEAQFPSEAESRRRVGKFYYRPPGGESWCDVALRVRSVVDTVGREHPDEVVLVVAHEVVIFMFRYVLERLTEQQILALNAEHELANCAVSEYELAPSGDRLVPCSFNLVPGEVPVTVEPDIPRAPR